MGFIILEHEGYAQMVGSSNSIACPGDGACSTPGILRCRNLKPDPHPEGRRVIAVRRNAAMAKRSAFSIEKCPLVCRPARNARSEVVGLGPLGVRHCFGGGQFRHRRFGPRSASPSSADEARRSGRSGDPRHRRANEQLGFSHPGRRLGTTISRSVSRGTESTRRKEERTSG